MWQYLKSREFWFTVLIMIALGIIFYLVFFFLFLPSYTRHGETVTVPDVSKMQLAEAQAEIEAAGLKLVVSDSLYISGLPPRSIISQDPTGLSTVKPERKIYLTVNKVVPPMVKFPDVINVSNYQAKLRLESWNLKIGEIQYRPHPYRNLVLGARVDGKKIVPGDSIPVGTLIDLIVGKGKGSSNIELPKLIGMPYQNAISVMHQLGLNIGSIKFDPNSDKADGEVFDQYPRYIPGDSIHLGEQISLFIAGEQPEETIEGLLEGYIDSESGSLKEMDKAVPEDGSTGDEEVDAKLPELGNN